MPSSSAHGLQLGHLRVVQAGGDQQDAVGAHGARLVDLVGIDDEVLAQHRQVARRAGLLQEGPVPWKKRSSVSTDRQAAPPAIVAGGDLGRHRSLAQHALARAGLLDLGDHGAAAGAMACASRARSHAVVAAACACIGSASLRSECRAPPRFPRA
jgi:hypothetical protein